MSHVPVQTKKTLTKTYDYPTELNTNYDAETTSDVEKIKCLREQKGKQRTCNWILNKAT